MEEERSLFAFAFDFEVSGLIFELDVLEKKEVNIPKDAFVFLGGVEFVLTCIDNKNSWNCSSKLIEVNPRFKGGEEETDFCGAPKAAAISLFAVSAAVKLIPRRVNPREKGLCVQKYIKKIKVYEVILK